MKSHFSKLRRSFRAFLRKPLKTLSEVIKTVHTYPRAIGLMWHASPKEMTAFSLLNLLSAVVTPLQIWLSKYIIDEVVAAVQATENTSTIHVRMIMFLIGLQVFIWLVSNAMTSFTNMLRYPFSLKVIHFTEERIFQKVARLDLAFFESPTFFNQMTRARGQAAQRTVNFVNNVSALLASVLVLMSLLIMVGTLHILAMLSIIFLSMPIKTWAMRPP